MASYKSGSITLENVYGKKTYETTIVECSSSTELQELTITENGTYTAPEGAGYSPVKVNVPKTVESGTLKSLLDETKSAYNLFAYYKGTNVDNLIRFSDTSNVTTMTSMFSACSNITTIPLLDTSNLTDASYMFYFCSNLPTIPLLDTSKVNTMPHMFAYCNKLTSIPELNTSKVTNMEQMFYNCYELTSIPQLDTSKVTNMNYMFSNCRKLTSIGMYGFTRSIDISDTALEHDALVAFLNQAGTAYNSNQKITMGSAKLALLSDEEKAIATNKGWTLA